MLNPGVGGGRYCAVLTSLTGSSLVLYDDDDDDVPALPTSRRALQLWLLLFLVIGCLDLVRCAWMLVVVERGLKWYLNDKTGFVFDDI